MNQEPIVPTTSEVPMKIKDLHPDMDRYLKHDCYCPNEVYSPDGFFYQLVMQEDETKILRSNEKTILALWKNQILVVFLMDNMIGTINRVDATENNLRSLTEWFDSNYKVKIKQLDEFPDNKTAENLQKILSIADAVMVTRR